MLGRIAACLIVGLMLLGSGMAQEPEPTEPEPEEVDPRDVGRPPQEPARSVVDSLTMSRHSRFGVALGAYEAYSDNVYATSNSRVGSGITALSPSVFTNFASRRTRFHADYAYGYYFYYRSNNLNTDAHHLNLDYLYSLTRKLNFYAYERLNDSVNESYAGFSGFAFPGGPVFAGSGEFVRGRQKVFRNDSALGLDYQVARHGTLSVSGGYQIYRYHLESYEDMSAAFASVRYAHQIKRWLRVSAAYLRYFTDASSRYQDRQIDRLQAGSFAFQLSRRWEFAFGGGVDYSRRGSPRRSIVTGSGSASLTHETSSNVFALRYSRGLSTYFGQDGIYASNIATVSFLQRLSRNVSGQLLGYFHRGSEYGGDRILQYYGGTASLQYGLRADLIASVNYSYRNQRSSSATTGFSPWNYDRSVAYAGITWFWPAQ